jgi:hypothetical protein
MCQCDLNLKSRFASSYDFLSSESPGPELQVPSDSESFHWQPSSDHDDLDVSHGTPAIHRPAVRGYYLPVLATVGPKEDNKLIALAYESESSTGSVTGTLSGSAGGVQRDGGPSSLVASS